MYAVQLYCSFPCGIYDAACMDHWDLWASCNRGALSDTLHQNIRNGVLSGRAGKGIVYVASAGNDAYMGGRVNFKGLQNSIYTISVAATSQWDTHAFYSTVGVANFISAPGGEPLDGAMVSAHPPSCRASSL